MALDITKLTGYSETMTAEEKLGLLANYEPSAPDLTGYIKKSTFDTTASELAEAKRMLKTKLTEDEKKEAERVVKEAERETELATLRKESAVSKTKAQFLGLGYDEKLATETATALADGDMDKVFANQKIFIETVKKVVAAEDLTKTPQTPPGGGKDKPLTKDDVKTMSVAQLNELYTAQPEVFKQITQTE